MKKSYQLSLFIFRRDLRLADNTGLLQALRHSEVVIPCFIFDPRQITEQNAYFSSAAVQFMIESLKDLENQLAKHHANLYIFHGKPEEIIESLFKTLPIEALFANQDYTPFSIRRDEALKKVCLHHQRAFHAVHDLLLTKPDQIVSSQGTPYTKFTPFFKKASHMPIAHPEKNIGGHFYTKPITTAQPDTFYKTIVPRSNPVLAQQGGRTHALQILTNLADFKRYKTERNYPALSTTLLSGHNKFGTVSIREVYHAIGEHLGYAHILIQQLFWRDFFTHIAYHSPFVFGQSFHEKYNALVWNSNPDHFQRWCTGNTGFPIVDAGMRQLNATGFMHNRVRMIVASFLVKDLHIDWRWGEQYFATRLVDYDPAVNNGNWQWCASTGCDSQPYFRIFNPWLQQKKFDPECIYIKRWIPELKTMDSKLIHTWYKQKSSTLIDYPLAMLDHGYESSVTKKLYTALR